jgi:hypothetical protein
MQAGDFAKEYQAKTDEELLRLAMDSEQLTSEAKTYLTSEFARRGINAEELSAFREEEALHRTGVRHGSVASLPLVSGKNSYTLGPPLPAEAPKTPWRPKTAGRIAFFFGPIAGAQIVAISLRRMGHQQTAKKVIFLALGMSAAEAVLLFFIPDAASRLVGFGAEIAFLLIFPVFMENAFTEWEASHPTAKPSSGWNAVGWGLAGSIVFLAISLIVFLLLTAVITTRR